jgi:hypothetical protein
LELKQQLGIAETKYNPRIIKDRNQQLDDALTREAELQTKLNAEKAISQKHRSEADGVFVCARA